MMMRAAKATFISRRLLPAAQRLSFGKHRAFVDAAAPPLRAARDATASYYFDAHWFMTHTMRTAAHFTDDYARGRARGSTHRTTLLEMRRVYFLIGHDGLRADAASILSLAR